MSYDPRIESIKAYKRIIEYFKRQIAKLEREIFSERCCWEKKTRLPITNKKRIRKRQFLLNIPLRFQLNNLTSLSLMSATVRYTIYGNKYWTTLMRS